RLHMPDGPIDATTLASRSVGDASFFGPFDIESAPLVRGRNVLAVEVHQSTEASTDVAFGMEVIAARFVHEGNPYRESREEWAELHNRSDGSVALSGWAFDRGVDFIFPSGTVIGAGGYLVVTNDLDYFRSLRPGIDAVGPFEGTLSNRNDRLVLIDPRGNPADLVEYFDGGRWPDFADGGGSSLELRDRRADNSVAEAWGASDESARSEWREYSYRMVSRQLVGPSRWNELILGLNEAGEVWIDDLVV